METEKIFNITQLKLSSLSFVSTKFGVMGYNQWSIQSYVLILNQRLNLYLTLASHATSTAEQEVISNERQYATSLKDGKSENVLCVR